MKKLIIMICIFLSSITYAKHEIGEFLLNNLVELRSTEVIAIKKLTTSTPIGEHCQLLHKKHNQNYVLNEPLKVVDVYSRVKENSYGVTSGYMKYALAIAVTSESGNFLEIICNAGTVKKLGTRAYTFGYVDMFAMDYKTNIDDIHKFLGDYFIIDMGDREETIIELSGRSDIVWAESSVHEKSAYNNLLKKADKECREKNMNRFRILEYSWSSRITGSKDKINANIKCY